MKVIAFNGSARKNGNTEILIKHVFTEGMETMVLGQNMAWLLKKVNR
jgi:multimeric flavodoxin WrbA